MTDKLRELLEDVQTVYEGKRMVVHPNSFDRLRMEVIKLDNINVQQSEQLTKAKFLLKQLVDAFPKSYSDVVKDTLDEAEQFLKENA